MNERYPVPISNGAMICIRRAEALDQERAFDIWCCAVDSTHHFLTPTDRVGIEGEVRDLLQQVPLWLAVDESDRPLGFMLLEGSHLGGLFVDPLRHGMGIGRALIRRAFSFYSDITTDVNEQNTRAIGST